MSDSVQPYGLQPVGLLPPWGSPARILEWVAVPSSGDLPEPGVEPMSLALAGRFFTTSATWEVPLEMALKAGKDQR